MSGTNPPTSAEAAIYYASIGWTVIPVRGKVPQGGTGWPSLATRDPGEAACLFEDWPHDGVGVLLGERSGIIDVECDNEQAAAELVELFGGEIPLTPCFQSARGRHYLFRLPTELATSKAKVMLGAIEVRLGGGGKAAQTVFPPSAGRSWLVAPDACEPAELPAEIVARIAETLAPKALERPAPQASLPMPHGDDQLDVGRWLARRGVEVLATEATGDVRKWFVVCPHIDRHTTKNSLRDCVVTQEASSGRLGGNCFHASCGMSDWSRLSEAIGKPTRQDYHPDEPDVEILPGVAEAILRQNERAAEDDDDEAEDEADLFADLTDHTFPGDCLAVPGLVGEIIRHTLATSLYPQPELALAGAIALVGTITGRKVTDAYRTRTNVYVLGLGLSGAGKEHARAINKEILIRGQAEKLIGSERVGSHAGIVTTIHDQPATLMQLDEMGRLLETMKDPRKAPHLFNCITVLMQLYSSSGTIWKADAYADAKKVKTIDQPHLCIYGTATPDSFWHSLSTDNIAEGLIGRLLVFEGRGYEVEMQSPSTDTPPQTIVDAVRWWQEYRPGGGNLSSEHPQPKRVPHTPEADDRFLSHIKAINARRIKEHPLRAAVWSRSGEKVAKLALIHACSRSRCLPETITREDVDWGIRLGNWLTRRLLAGCANHVSENEVEAKSKRILNMIPDRGITLELLGRRTQWLRARERQEILADLERSRLICFESIATDRRPKTIIKKFKKNLKTAS